ncbi:unnamed protein product, partial [Rotaria sp. Silwood2]
MNPVTIAYHFFRKIQQKYNLKEEDKLTDTENEKVNQLISFFQEIVSSHNLVIETEYTLDLSEDEDISESENDNIAEGEDDNASESENDFEAQQHSEKYKYSYEQMQKIVDKSERMSFNTLKHQYRKLKNPTEVSRIRKYIAKGGTDYQKYELIKDFVWKKFQLARSKYLPVKDEDLKKWALQKSQENKLESFTASHDWIRWFKINRKISSRKITKVISSKSEIDIDEIIKQGRAFVKVASKELMNFDRSII